jgi:hypothetical protein
MRRFSPSMITSLLALFVALSGTTYAAATGGSLGLGKSNSAKATTGLSSTGAGPTLVVANTAGQPAAAFSANNGVAPFTVSGAAKVSNLNADQLDGLDSSAFALKGAPNDGANDNGLYGRSFATLASGVYGENVGQGYGVAGRTASGQRGALFGENTGGGPALELHTASNVAPMTVDSSVKVEKLNADTVDGIDGGAFVQGRTYTLADSFPADTTYWPAHPVAPDWFDIGFECGQPGYRSATGILVKSMSSDPVNVFHSNRTNANSGYIQIPPGSNLKEWLSVDGLGDLTTLSIQGTPGGRQSIATIVIGTARRLSGDCHIQMQALFTQM